MSQSLQPHGLQHARLPCPSPSPGVCSNSGPSSQWCISSFCHPFLLPSIFPSIRVFSSESALCIREPEYWSFSFSISASSEYWGLISFRMVWLDLLAIQGALKSLLQHHSSRASILWYSAFFMVQLLYPYKSNLGLLHCFFFFFNCLSLLGSPWIIPVPVQSLSRVQLLVTPWIAAPRHPCPSLTSGVHSNSCPSSPWCHPAISSSVVPFSSCPQSLSVLQEGGPFPEPETGLLSNTRKWIVRGDTSADKVRDFIGKGHRVESSRVREPRRTALPRGLQSRVLWRWD